MFLNYKWIGALLLISASGILGIRLSYSFQREESMLLSLKMLLEEMECELTYRLTPLPELCGLAANNCTDKMVQSIFHDISECLNRLDTVDVRACVEQVLMEYKDLPISLRKLIERLGTILGQMDMEGQLKSLKAAISQCDQCLSRVTYRKEDRIRSCRTLGFCIGTALVILCI